MAKLPEHANGHHAMRDLTDSLPEQDRGGRRNRIEPNRHEANSLWQ